MKELNTELKRQVESSVQKYVKTGENCLIIKTGSNLLQFDPVEESELLKILVERSTERHEELNLKLNLTPKKKSELSK